MAPRSLPAVVVLLAALAAGTARAGTSEGVAAYGRGDYAAAMREFAPAAAAGDVESQVMMGRLYAMGLGVPQDFAQAWVWNQRAASRGNREADAARVTMESVLTPAQLAEARRMAETPTTPTVTAETVTTPTVTVTAAGARTIVLDQRPHGVVAPPPMPPVAASGPPVWVGQEIAAGTRRR